MFDGNSEFYLLNSFDERTDTWSQINLIDILLDSAAVMRRFELPRLVGTRRCNPRRRRARALQILPDVLVYGRAPR